LVIAWAGAAEDCGPFLLGRANSGSGHLAAKGSARTTSFSAPDHKSVVAHLFATPGATLTDLCAGAACVNVQFRIAQHEIGAGLADLGAVGEQADVMRLREATTLIKTVSQRLQADAVTAAALFYALLHAAIAMLHGGLLGQ